jgi:hypothetical protein
MLPADFMTAAGPPSKVTLIIIGTRVFAEKFAELAAVGDVTESVRAAGGA